MTVMDEIQDGEADEKLYVWDLPIRIFHWTLALSIVGAYVTNRLGVAYFRYHVWFGYLILILVCFRLIWGLVGTRHALFRNFIQGPKGTIKYTFAVLKGKSAHYAGHNPLGAWMVIFLLGAILIQSVTGLFSNDEIFNIGPLYGYVAKETSLSLTSIHRQLFYLVIIAVSFHIVAVLAHHFLKREPLILAMITGRKPAFLVAERESISSSRTGLAVILVVVFSALLTWIVLHAPIIDEGF
ncbi:cytochrome b/b6 domain-containing protein [Beijerinckia mobilis]|uniref:cytochrome b/b6 domain-containing protein n=1 Tax=Beijerinckia mobilis TaxID=231434 RepID=UPI0005586DFB|nr:cytochrome b/b6 domain-containing protein [Beijerinckia mobilis]